MSPTIGTRCSARRVEGSDVCPRCQWRFAIPAPAPAPAPRTATVATPAGSRCPSCSRYAGPESAFCPHCGVALGRTPQPKADQPLPRAEVCHRAWAAPTRTPDHPPAVDHLAGGLSGPRLFADPPRIDLGRVERRICHPRRPDRRLGVPHAMAGRDPRPRTARTAHPLSPR